MRAKSLSVVALSLAAVTLCAQAPKNLSDPFAKAALFALKGIESDTTGSVSTATSDRIDKADSEATSAHETATVKYLKLVSLNHEMFNGWKKRLLERLISETHAANAEATVEVAQEKLDADRREIQFDREEKKCFSDLEASLRQRTDERPASCEAWIKERTKLMFP